MLTNDVFYLKMNIFKDNEEKKIKKILDSLLNMKTEIILIQDNECIFKLRNFGVDTLTKDREFHKTLLNIMVVLKKYYPHIVEFKEY